MVSRGENTITRHDEAARAGWLYYVAGNTQDQIAAKLGVSRQSAQRLVSLAVSEGLIKVRLDHPIAKCMELADWLAKRFSLDRVEWCRATPATHQPRSGWRRRPPPRSSAEAAGADRAGHRHQRTLKAAIRQLSPISARSIGSYR